MKLILNALILIFLFIGFGVVGYKISETNLVEKLALDSISNTRAIIKSIQLENQGETEESISMRRRVITTNIEYLEYLQKVKGNIEIEQLHMEVELSQLIIDLKNEYSNLR